MIQSLEKPSFDQRIQTLSQQYQICLQRMQQAQKDQVEARDAMLRIEGAIQALTEVKDEIWNTEDGQD